MMYPHCLFDLARGLHRSRAGNYMTVLFSIGRQPSGIHLLYQMPDRTRFVSSHFSDRCQVHMAADGIQVNSARSGHDAFVVSRGVVVD